jgi:hypothetical protein
MPMLERAFAGVQRNDPCPCGSGRKFKQCHGQMPHNFEAGFSKQSGKVCRMTRYRF